VTGLALAIFALIVRGVQADVARRKAEATELALTRAELRALRAQINPHFFFNALNTIRYCVRTDPEAARRLLLDLSEIFQRALRSGELEPLRDEIRYAEAYLAIEKARLGERLRVAWSLPQDDSPLLDHPIPTLILQPIVENAVIHGIARKPEGGTVTITLERRGGDLVLRVEDDGVGIDPSRLAELLDPAGEGEKAIGLRNVDGRLRAFYGEAHRLKIESQPEHGTQVEIRIPVIRDD
jgi:sensor histidine kinase YesM